MTIFEYLMVLVSIVLGLGVTQALRGLSKIARSETRYLPVTLWGGFLVYLYVQAWWAFWDLNAVAVWNQFYFTFIVMIAFSMFAATELLMPMGKRSETNWRAHYFKVRRWFFATMLTFTVLATLQIYVLLDVPLTHPYRAYQVTMAAIEITGLVTSNPRYQAWLPTLAISSTLLGQVLFRLFPGLAG